MIGLDTYVLVRYLTQDDAAQSRKAAAVIDDATTGGERCVIGPVVLCELLWVLRDAYDIPKDQLVEVLDRILDTRQFDVVDRARVREAVEAYRTGRADFADYLIGAVNMAAGCTETVTFDRHLRGAIGFRVL
ncbi:MAG TPA: type II toxin-antitoxin system VapC family toxin [Vicinamibacterales bacterium]